MEPFAKDTLTGRRTGETMRTKLASMVQRAEGDRSAKFCSLAHLMNKGTPREAFRLSNKEIAARLYLSEGTVRNSISVIFEKPHLKSRTQIAIFNYKYKRG